MASYTLSAPDLFPVGTTVSVWAGTQALGANGLPTGPPVTTAPHTTSATFTGLADDTVYYAGALVSGIGKLTNFRTDLPEDDADSLAELEAELRAYTDQVAAGGLELGYAELGTNPEDNSHTRSSVTPADVTGLSTTVTVGERPILVSFTGAGYHTTEGQGLSISILEDGVAIRRVSPTSGAANGIVNLSCSRRRAPAAGSHTYKIQLGSSNTSAATILLGSANFAAIHVVEV